MAKHRWILIVILLLLPAVLQCLFLFTAESVIDPGDQVNHYQLARFSWKHPHLLLDMWGKPLFTLIAAPFAKAGIKGIMGMNILLAAGMGFFAWKTADKLKLPMPWLAIPLTGLNPELFRNVITGYTETLFAFLLILILYLIVSRKYLLAAILISFLPFSRPEAWLVMPLLAVLFAVRGQWKWIPFFAAGTLLYSCIGYFHFKDFLWVFHKNPYNFDNDLYGSGPWNHFIVTHRKTWGRILTLGSIAGLAALPLYLFRVLKPQIEYIAEEILVVAGASLTILTAHSVMWYLGSYGSAGYVRVLTCFAPFCALLTLRGFSVAKPLLSRIKPMQQKIMYAGITVFVALWMSRTGFNAQEFPIVTYAGEKATLEFADRVRPEVENAPQVFYFHPYLGYLLDRDPDNYAAGGLLWGLNRQQPALENPSGTLILWDSKFSSVEIGLPLEVLFESNHLSYLYKYAPEEQVCYGDIVLEFYVFRRK
jgi:hypothetical protein